MGFLDSWISGCSNTQGLGEAITIFVAKLLNGLLGAFVNVINIVLRATVLSAAGDTTVAKTVHAIILSLDGLAVGLMIVLLIWSVLTSGEELMTKGRWDDWQGIVGRTGSAFLWMAGAGLVVPALILVNNQLVSAFSFTTLMHTKDFVNSCPTAVGDGTANLFMGIAAGTGASAAFLFLGLQGLFLLTVIAAVYVFWQWLSRLAEIMFWGSLLPLAAATLVSDSSRRMFDYVWRNVQGAIFTQAAMALGIYIFETAVLFNGKNSGAAGSHFLNMMVSIAGLFLIGRIPQYFKELHGHSSSGGFDAAQGAAAIMMARGAAAALSATPGGQFLGRAIQNTQATSDQRLGRSRVLGGMWHRMGQNITRGSAVKNFDQARYEATPGVMDLNYNAEAMRETHFAAWQKDQNDRWGPDDYAPLTQGGYRPGHGGGSRPEGFMGGRGSRGPQRGPSGSSGGLGMPRVTVERFDDATRAWTPTAAIPLGSGPEATPLAGQMPVASHAVGDSLATRGPQQVVQSPAQTADQFVKDHAEEMRNYLRHVVQPNTIAATSFQPEEQVAKVAELRDKYQRLAAGGAMATQTFAELSGVTVEQLERSDVQDRIAQDLAAKQWGGSLQSGDPDTLSLKHPLSNTGVQGVDVNHIARNFTGPPSAVAQHLKQMKDRVRSTVTGAPTPVERARNAGWNT